MFYRYFTNYLCEFYGIHEVLSVCSGKHIFDQVIGPSGILKNKTRILVTHGVGYLPQVDRIIVLSGCQISEIGNYTQLLYNNGAFADFLRTYYLDEQKAIEEDDPKGAEMKEKVLLEIGPAPALSTDRSRTQSILSSLSMKTDRRIRDAFRRESTISANHVAEIATALPIKRSSLDTNDDDDEENEDSKGRLMADETSEYGRVKWGVFNAYFKNATYLASVMMVVSYILLNVFIMAGNFWLTWWTRDNDYPERRNDTSWRDYRLGIYALFGVIQG